MWKYVQERAAAHPTAAAGSLVPDKADGGTVGPLGACIKRVRDRFQRDDLLSRQGWASLERAAQATSLVFSPESLGDRCLPRRVQAIDVVYVLLAVELEVRDRSCACDRQQHREYNETKHFSSFWESCDYLRSL